MFYELNLATGGERQDRCASAGTGKAIASKTPVVDPQ